MRLESFEEAVEVTRGGTVESVHAAAIAVCDPDGRLLHRLGDPAVEIVMRSAAKPFQAAAALSLGAADRWGLTPPEIALIAGSHAGEEPHQAAAASILAKAGLSAGALQCGAHVPFSRKMARALAREGRDPDPLMNNCSGKHAGMLAAAMARGYPVETYLDPSHPVQVANLGSVAEFTGRASASVGLGVDGCSAPTFKVSLRELARAFARLAGAGASGAAEGTLTACLARIARAMRAHPEMVAGEGMLDTSLMRLVPGLVAKVGADGIHAMGWLSPLGPVGIALKVMDGDTGAARTTIALSLLTSLGALNGVPLPETLARQRVIRNHRKIQVGEVRPVFDLRRES